MGEKVEMGQIATFVHGPKDPTDFESSSPGDPIGTHR